jgi:hypothetical protein
MAAMKTTTTAIRACRDCSLASVRARAGANSVPTTAPMMKPAKLSTPMMKPWR